MSIIAIHRKLFQGIYKHAGKIRDYNITKKEWVLDGATVMYGSASELRDTLEYDFSQEKNFSYKGLSMDEIIHRSGSIHFTAMANPYFRGRQYENNGSVLYQIFEDTWVLCNQ